MISLIGLQPRRNGVVRIARPGSTLADERRRLRQREAALSQKMRYFLERRTLGGDARLDTRVFEIVRLSNAREIVRRRLAALGKPRFSRGDKLAA